MATLKSDKLFLKVSLSACAMALSMGAGAQSIGFSFGAPVGPAQIHFRSIYTPMVVHSDFAPAPYLENIPLLGYGWAWESGRWIREGHRTYRWIPGRALYVGPPPRYEHHDRHHHDYYDRHDRGYDHGHSDWHR